MFICGIVGYSQCIMHEILNKRKKVNFIIKWPSVNNAAKKCGMHATSVFETEQELIIVIDYRIKSVK